VPDGTIQYAENHPKKIPGHLPFFRVAAGEALAPGETKLRCVVEDWSSRAVASPRRHPPYPALPFWEVSGKSTGCGPDVIFLAEGLHAQGEVPLAKLGFTSV